MTPLPVLAPLTGVVLPLDRVPDPAFAQGLIGPGVALDPAGEREVTAVAPIDGRLLIVRSHAYVTVDEHGRGVLVHLGIDTVELRGRGFARLRAKGDLVRAGEPVTRWDLGELDGRSPLCPVVALEAGPVLDPAVGTVHTGERLFVWNNSAP